MPDIWDTDDGQPPDYANYEDDDEFEEPVDIPCPCCGVNVRILRQPNNDKFYDADGLHTCDKRYLKLAHLFDDE